MPRRSALPSLLFVIAATCLPLCGCQTSQVSPYVKDGRRYGVTRGTFNARWWNYYERGLSFADGEFWKEAERDLLSALAQNDGEERRAQTYGMHFIEYFPHRELGVVYYRQNRLDEAERELLRSLEDEDTAKAHYFLAQVRGQALRRGGRDARPPTVTLPGGDTWYSSSTHFMLRGIMQDDHAVAAYAVNDTSYYVREPRKAVPLEVRMALAAAQTPLTITAVDLVGNTTIHHATILLDQTGPFLVVEKKTRLVEGWEISGRATDNLGAVELTLDDRRVALQEGRFTAVARGADRAVLRARDRAGNATELAIKLAENGGAAPRLGPRLGSLPSGTKVAALEGEEASIRLLRQPPARVGTEYFTLHLDLAAESEIVRVSIAGEPIVGLPRARTLTFSHSVELSEGRNTIEIAMETSSGARRSRSVTLERIDAEKPLRAERLRLAFADLLPAEESDTPLSLCQSFNRGLEFQLSERGRFGILARRELEKVLLERKLSLSGLADPRYATRLAGLAVADEVLTGTIRVRRDGIVAETRLVDVRTGEVDAAADVFAERTDTRTLDMLARALALELEYRFPVVRGRIVESRDGGAFVMDKGARDGLREGLPVVVFEQEEFDTLIRGRGRLDAVRESRSRGRLDDPAQAVSIRAGLEVMTR